MKKSIFSLFVLSLLFISCGKSDDNLVIEPQPEATYSVEDITYTLQEDDSIRVVTHTLAPIQFSNRTASLIVLTYYDEDDDYSTTSLFMFTQPLPEDIEANLFKINTPYTFSNKKVYSIDRGWVLTNVSQTRPYGTDKTEETVQVPAMSRIIVNRSFDEEVLQASFVVTIKNDLTGELTSFSGKWKGTLNYTYRFTEFKEEGLN
ncbi:hypothetical protein [uncultured Bacteroides sp.]|uniref:hypothetical protein n=1 Tax=uncultured Bacteroides sp. TaxID=162156 RepID=UPI002AA84E2D|nr:hypothetical protein [uncultured Bacteroides sp.]